MVGRRRRVFNVSEAIEFLNQLLVDNPLLPFLIPVVLVVWAVERWIFSLSNWVPLVVAVWATIQVCFLVGFVFSFVQLLV